MALDTISEARLDEVHPEVSRRIHQLDQVLDAKYGSFFWRITRGLATQDEQLAYYSQGRSPIEVVNSARAKVGMAAITPAENVVVTNAAPGYSAHEFGYAVDADPSMPGAGAYTPDWNVADSQWQELLAMANSCGLAEGAMWRSVKPDNPHFYLQELPPTPTDTMRAIRSAQGMGGIIEYINKLLGISIAGGPDVAISPQAT